MSAPFYKLGMFGTEVSLIIAFLIGIGFGFFLERAGFGNACLLAAQFYFRDLRVLKVMFTAIVTAMVGLYVLARVGVVDLSLVYLTPTFVMPQIVGGLLLGVGFIVGGYCPGTSCVSAATGRIDGMVYVAGMIAGLLGFAEVYPRIAGFAKSTGMGQVTLPQFLNIPYGVLVLAVVLMALGAFVAAEWAEKRIGGKAPDADSLTTPTRRLVPVRRFALVLLAGGVFAALAGNPYRGATGKVDTRQLALDASSGANRVRVTELAEWLIQGRNDFILVDVRDAASFERYHLPAAISQPLASISSDIAARTDRIICYSDNDAQAAEASVLLRSLGYSAAYALAGGLEAWRADVLYPKAPPSDASPAAQVEFARRSAIAKHFGGAPLGASAVAPAAPDLPTVAPVPASNPGATPPAPRKKKEGC